MRNLVVTIVLLFTSLPVFSNSKTEIFRCSDDSRAVVIYKSSTNRLFTSFKPFGSRDLLAGECIVTGRGHNYICQDYGKGFLVTVVSASRGPTVTIDDLNDDSYGIAGGPQSIVCK